MFRILAPFALISAFLQIASLATAPTERMYLHHRTSRVISPETTS